MPVCTAAWKIPSPDLRFSIPTCPRINPMTDTPDEPDWSLLPRDPIRFFGLPEGFDRRELKRRYNELIRRFKPERHPAEFQRIRAAYEQLDSGIRYGLETTWNAPTADSSWPADFHPTPRTAPSFSRTTSPVLLLHERLQRESALDVYRELESKTEKTAFDFYALAVMSDVVDPQDGKQFSRWLLEGLASHQRDIGLLRLMNTYLRSSVDAKDCAPLLVKCSQIIHENTFFPLTEPLWRTLLKSQEFSLFRTTLQQCESNLKGVSIDGRIAFYLQILKSAMWVADEAWINESLGFVETNFERIPQFLDFDVEMVTRLPVIRCFDAWIRQCAITSVKSNRLATEACSNAKCRLCRTVTGWLKRLRILLIRHMVLSMPFGDGSVMTLRNVISTILAN